MTRCEFCRTCHQKASLVVSLLQILECWVFCGTTVVGENFVQKIPTTINGTKANVPCAEFLERSYSVRLNESDDSTPVHEAGQSIVISGICEQPD